MKELIKINSRDNVVIALRNFTAGETINVDGKNIVLLNDVEKGHKIALTDIAEGGDITKYGYPIGKATQAIKTGEHVHVHNVRTKLGEVFDYSYNPHFAELPHKDKHLTFNGYRRKNGEVGIRNEIWIVPTVGCVNGIAEQIIREFKAEVNPTGIDGMEVFKHNYGCSQLGDDHVNTRQILGDIAMHPNAGGVLVLGLGCENNKIDEFADSLGDFDRSRIKFMSTQKVQDEVSDAIALLKEIYAEVSKDVREPVSLSELKVGLKCGGSDGLSGITANPLVGYFSDFLISQGGTTTLTEVPEMFGAETILMDRCISPEVFDKTVHLINDFKQYFIDLKQPIYENPSPGNKAGGITTLEDKSLGCTQKGGIATVVDVLKYGERLHTKGLNLLSSPGNDLVSTTALGASGCHMVLFTTGRGTPFGSFIPTLKISTNSELAKNKPHWIDYNAGPLAEDKTFDEGLEELVDKIIRIANGEKANHERAGFREIAIFKSGVTL
ncbi:altronate dehydratase family protein [uncultured Mucilaginibacter sp.]|uniref:UxaA family hydrolase n=1 Tax=uncultured Mucilaginibacter sp. TaxID=797541 RepID=UPI0025FEFF47|nr:altronate dehydratase family protein [uncultured Mucilaginibacter sp.]